MSNDDTLTGHARTNAKRLCLKRSACQRGRGVAGPPTSDEHGADGEDLLGVGVGGDVAEAHAGEAGQGEVERGDVDAPQGGPAGPRPVPVPQTQGVVRRLQTLPQLMEPAWRTDGWMDEYIERWMDG